MKEVVGSLNVFGLFPLLYLRDAGDDQVGITGFCQHDFVKRLLFDVIIDYFHRGVDPQGIEQLFRFSNDMILVLGQGIDNHQTDPGLLPVI